MSLGDAYRRPLKDLRISVTDRCNYRCHYCMPLDEYDWIEKAELLSFEEIVRLAGLFLQLGVEKIRVTGGEPLVRKDLDHLISQLSVLPGLRDLSLTTNGSFLSQKAASLKQAGLSRINVSLDTLNADRFKQITKRGTLEEVLDGISTAQRIGLEPVKVNAVVVRGVNDDEVLDLVRFSRNKGIFLRFIEYMDVGNANQWSLEKTVTKKEILDSIQAKFPLREIGRKDLRAPAVDYEFVDGKGQVGVIGSVTESFCSSCSRGRLTADGKFVTCLFASSGHDLKTLLRSGAGDVEVLETISSVWSERVDRYSDLRWERIASNDQDRPSEHPKIEMITLGG